MEVGLQLVFGQIPTLILCSWGTPGPGPGGAQASPWGWLDCPSERAKMLRELSLCGWGAGQKPCGGLGGRGAERGVAKRIDHPQERRSRALEVCCPKCFKDVGGVSPLQL